MKDQENPEKVAITECRARMATYSDEQREEGKKGLGTVLEELWATLGPEAQQSVYEGIDIHYRVLGKLVQEEKLKLLYFVNDKFYSNLNDLPGDVEICNVRIFYELVK